MKHLLPLLLAALVLFSTPAHAIDATVVAVTRQHDNGQWRPAPEATADIVRGGETAQLALGDKVGPGESVRVGDRLRFVLELADGSRITVQPGSELELKARSEDSERGVVQSLGELYLELMGAFSVDYETVEATVEGTELSVAIMTDASGVANAAQFRVTEGAVRVTGQDGSSTLLKRGQELIVAKGGAVPSASSTPLAQRSKVTNKAWALGRPRAIVGVMAEGGFVGDHGDIGGRVFAGVSTLRVFRVTFDTGFGFGGQVSRLPTAVGAEWVVGGLAFGGQILTEVEITPKPCGSTDGTLHIGGVGTARLSVPLSRRLSIEGQVRGGATDRVVIDGAAGIGVSL